MIWYLLYPFRGTTEPPVLSPNHPIRRTFYRHGTSAARHWLAYILLSVAIAVFVCYPVFFLYDNPTSGFSKLPYHVWTSARRFDGNQSISADVEVRQVWVHGSYMRALEKDVLVDALNIQQALVSPEPLSRAHKDVATPSSKPEPEVSGDACVQKDVSGLSWAFHSPLMFWNCSQSAISADPNPIRTINEQSLRRSGFNLTLLPASVFAGKSFVENKLVAADALVITLFERPTVGIAKPWNQRLAALAAEYPDRWSFYPEDGIVTRSQLYEFQFKPMSIREDFLLFFGYAMMFMYVVVNLRRTRAVKSHIGVVVTIITQITISIVASFTICGFLKIDLARIPQEVYPFVVLVIGLENMFRLVNAVLAHPPEGPTTLRIANALGDVGHLSLAAAGQNLAVLWVMAKFVSPGVQAFCMFAAVALIFDFIFHLTFFVAVLSVDVRRMELQESIDRAKSSQSKAQGSRTTKQFWADALLQGRLPFSTRIAGSAVSICFIITLNVHFSDADGFTRIIFSWFFAQDGKSRGDLSPPFAPPPINQARTPQAWLRIQDYHSAQEVIKFVKSNSHTLIARMYDPLMVVLSGSDRSGVLPRTNSLLFYWEIVDRHIYPFLLSIISAVAIVTLLMQYMLWNELPDEELGTRDIPKSNISVKNVQKPHKLDIFKLTASGKGHLIAVSLDRFISIHTLNAVAQTYAVDVFQVIGVTAKLWPIISIAIDETTHWAAFCSSSGKVAFWNVAERRLSHFVDVKVQDQHILVFALISLDSSKPETISLVVVSPDGWVRLIDVESSQEVKSFQICSALSSATIARTKYGSNIVCTSRKRELYEVTLHASDHTTVALHELDPRLSLTTKADRVRFITIAPPLLLFAAVRSQAIDLIDLSTHLLINTIELSPLVPQSFRILHSPLRECRTCQSPAIHSISFAYTNAGVDSCTMRTYVASDSYNSLICLRPTTNTETRTCKGLEAAEVTIQTVENPGSWESTSVQAIVGIRSRSAVGSLSSTASGSEISNSSPFNVKHRLARTRPAHQYSLNGKASTLSRPPTFTADIEDWEVWTLSSAGDMHTISLPPVNEDDLFVTSPGPIVRLGKRSVAITLGNVIKVVAVGNERFEEEVDEWQELALVGNRRRKAILRKDQ